MTRSEATDLIVVLESLTALMVRLAAEAVSHGASTNEMREAHEMLEAFRDVNTGDIEFIEKRRHFYDTLMLIGGNSQLPSIMPIMRIHLLRLQAQHFLSEEDRRDRLNEYSEITHAVLAGEAALSERSMRRHMKAMKLRIQRLPDEAFRTAQY